MVRSRKNRPQPDALAEFGSPQAAGVLIVSPGAAQDNNGNWRTADRWRRLLAPDWHATVVPADDDTAAGLTAAADRGPVTRPAAGLATRAGQSVQVLIALHARRSAAAVKAWSDARHGPVVVVLTGTDLYRDIHVDATARESLARADHLVVLNQQGIADLPAAFRAKARCILQSSAVTARGRPPARARQLRVLMVGHLRPEKAPATYFAVARQLGSRRAIRLDHIGAALDRALGEEAHMLAGQEPRYRYLGALPHGETLRRIRNAHVLVHPSVLEGGAHVVLEAVRLGTPVLASRISGNLGLLGVEYQGCFAPGDAAALLGLLDRCQASQGRADGFLADLSAQCARRAVLFDPEQERTSLLELLNDCLKP